MGKKKSYYKSSKECENIHVFMESWYGVKSHHRKRTRFHHNDMPIYLMNRGVTPPRSVSLDIASKDDSDRYVYVRDDNENIRCYDNCLALNKNEILSSNLSANERENKRKEILKSLGYGYDEVTGEVELLEELEEEMYLDGVVPTEKVNRQKNISKRNYYYGRRR